LAVFFDPFISPYFVLHYGANITNVYRVGQKSTLLILSEYVNKTEKMGGILTTKNSYRENEVLSDIFM